MAKAVTVVVHENTETGARWTRIVPTADRDAAIREQVRQIAKDSPLPHWELKGAQTITKDDLEKSK